MIKIAEADRCTRLLANCYSCRAPSRSGEKVHQRKLSPHTDIFDLRAAQHLVRATTALPADASATSSYEHSLPHTPTALR